MHSCRSEARFLAWGHRPDSHTHLHGVAYGYKDGRLKQVWRRHELFEGELSVQPARGAIAYHYLPRAAVRPGDEWAGRIKRARLSAHGGDVVLRYRIEREWDAGRRQSRPVPRRIEVYRPTAQGLTLVATGTGIY